MFDASKNNDEKRLFERLDFPVKVSYEISNRPHDFKTVDSKNISGGGICISLQEKLVNDARLKIKIEAPKTKPDNDKFITSEKSRKTKPDYFELNGRVAWTRKVEIKGGTAPSFYYDTGIQFLDVDPVIVGEIVSYFPGRQF